MVPKLGALGRFHTSSSVHLVTYHLSKIPPQKKPIRADLRVDRDPPFKVVSARLFSPHNSLIYTPAYKNRTNKTNQSAHLEGP